MKITDLKFTPVFVLIGPPCAIRRALILDFHASLFSLKPTKEITGFGESTEVRRGRDNWKTFTPPATSPSSRCLKCSQI
jgi:hypothetical protein